MTVYEHLAYVREYLESRKPTDENAKYALDSFERILEWHERYEEVLRHVPAEPSVFICGRQFERVIYKD